jgi:hypothetical protein
MWSERRFGVAVWVAFGVAGTGWVGFVALLVDILKELGLEDGTEDLAIVTGIVGIAWILLGAWALHVILEEERQAVREREGV